MSNSDITRVIISDSHIKHRIGSIFSDSIILDNKFNFISISQNILDATGYSFSELSGQSFSLFSRAADLLKFLKQKLAPGYFEETHFEVSAKNNGSILYGISGFYLGLIADINGMIVLKLRNLDEINIIYEKLEEKTIELDRFVYLSAHALRGPLATIKGLINLAKNNKDTGELDFLIQQLDVFAEKLDDKLHRLIYFAESDKGNEAPDQNRSLQSVYDTLVESMKEASVDNQINFKCETEGEFLVVDHGDIILALLKNIVLFFCQQNKNADNQVVFDAYANQGATEIIIRSQGFHFSQALTERLRSVNFGYSEILNYPELINCYAAKKIVLKLRGKIQFLLPTCNEVIVMITIPRSSEPPSGN
jgi:signal transduction histidine kinase